MEEISLIEQPDDVDVFQLIRDGNTPLSLCDDPIVIERMKMLNDNRAWLKKQRKERPNPLRYQKVAVYIRYYNQTKYDNYLDYHKLEYLDILAQCPNWEFVDFYVDEGQSAPRMQNAKEWSRLLTDAMDGKVDLIITSKVSNVSRNPNEITFCTRLLASQKHPIGIYFIGEDMFTLASYYRHDLKDDMFYPYPEWQLLPDDEEEKGVKLLHE